MSAHSDLSGKRFVVTGASRGIGRTIANHLAELGASLVLIARDRAALEAVRGSLTDGDHTVAALDVADEDAWCALTENAPWSTRVDGVVAAAGVIGPIGPIGSWTVAQFEETLRINVTGTLLAISSFLPVIRQRRGAIVTLSGGGATAPFARFDAYATSKAAVVRLTENLACDLLDDGVRVNAIAPGFIVTDMHDATIAAGPELVGQAYFDRTVRAIESGAGDPPQLAADLAAFLLSSDAHGITGKLLSARWDPWQEAPFAERLRSDADFCTLRRIDAQFFDASPSK